MRRITLFLLMLMMSATRCWHAQAAEQEPTLARVMQAGVLRCGSAIRPGLAFPATDHSWYGLHVELCRAIAAAVLGDPGKIEFTGYALGRDFRRIGTGADDVAFLTTTELFANELFGAVLTGPTVYQLTTRLMVPDASPIHAIGEVGHTMVCAEPGTTAERALNAYAVRHQWTVNFSGWMELEEMMDAFAAGRCPAVVGEETALAALRLGAGQGGHPARILDEPLSAASIMAVTPADGPWSQVVTWSVDTVLAGDGSPLPVAGSWLGLDRDWQTRIAAQGGFAAMMRRTLGEGSPLGLPPGLNAGWQQGGTMTAPSVE